MTPAYARRKDLNHADLSEAASKLGWYVVDTSQFAQYHAGWPDAVWAKAGRTVLVEYKVGAARLTDDEALFAAAWPGEYEIVRSVDDVVKVTGGGDAMSGTGVFDERWRRMMESLEEKYARAKGLADAAKECGDDTTASRYDNECVRLVEQMDRLMGGR